MGKEPAINHTSEDKRLIEAVRGITLYLLIEFYLFS